MATDHPRVVLFARHADDADTIAVADVLRMETVGGALMLAAAVVAGMRAVEIHPDAARAAEERAGLVREVVRLVQERRKSSGLEVSDRITLAWAATGDLAAAIRAHAALIASEVLATTVVEDEPGDEWATDDDLGLTFSISKV